MYNVEMIVKDALTEQLDYMRFHTEEIEFMYFMQPKRDLELIRRTVRLIQRLDEEDIKINEGYVNQPNQSYSLSITSSGNESVQMLGDYYTQEQIVAGRPSWIRSMDFQAPQVHVESIAANELICAGGQLWLGAVIKSPFNTIHVIKNIYKIGANEKIELDPVLPQNISYLGKWSAYPSVFYRDMLVCASGDQVQVSVQLATAGELGLHMCLRQLVRYMIKRARLTSFERYGFINTILSYSSVIRDDDDMTFKTHYHIAGTALDRWVAETSQIKGLAPITAELYATDGAADIAI